VLPYSPLARGLLAGTRHKGQEPLTLRAGGDPLATSRYDESDFEIVDAVREIAAETSSSPAQVSLAWLLSRPAVNAVVVGATKIAHIDDALRSLAVSLDAPAAARLESLYTPRHIQGHE
jgi:1-deoxyxylulose-5-phosphate synthase